ncbi:MAG: DNA polymerase III subunit delta' [Bacillota bacterium]|nr:MAG: DNA polymerase III subunit delta' [Bacillota bacterium]
MKKAYYFFEQTIKKNRLSHLYLISGPKGSGKAQLVDDVAFLILSQNKKDTTHLKTQIQERKVSNIMYIEPDGLSIKKEQILLLQAEFSKTALVTGPRIYIIKSVEKISQAAANSLLKFMEEPQSHFVFGFLLTENLDEVLPTIQSRSQILHLKSIDEKDLELELIKQGVSDNVAVLAPYLTKNIDEALALADNPNFIEMISFLEDLIKVWSDKNISYPLYFADSARFLVQDRDFFMNFLELLLLYFLDLIHYKAHQDITYTFLRDYIQSQSNQMSIQAIQDLIDEIQDILKRQSYYINLDLALDQLAYILEKKR